jgi:WD40 repeat protein
MKKIFQIINLSYYNYYLSSNIDKNQITFSKQLVDFNIISKKIDMNDLIYLSKKLLTNFQEENQLYNFEYKFDVDEYKKKYTLKSPEDPECITKIIEINKYNKLVSSLINGKIYVWDLNSNNLDYSIDAHNSSIWSMIKLSNDNIVTGSSDKLIKIFNILDQSSDPIIKLRGHKGTIFCLGELEKNKILSGSEDRTIKLWDLETKKCILTLEDPNESKINCLYILKDFRFVLTGGNDNLIKIWNIYSEYIPNVLIGHECTIWSLASISDDDTIIASGSSDNTIKIWDLINLKCLFSLEGHENTISSLKVLNNSLLVSSSWDQTSKIWNLRTKECVFTLKGHKNIVWDVIQLDSGDIATCSSDMSIIVWSKNS